MEQPMNQPQAPAFFIIDKDLRQRLVDWISNTNNQPVGLGFNLIQSLNGLVPCTPTADPSPSADAPPAKEA